MTWIQITASFLAQSLRTLPTLLQDKVEKNMHCWKQKTDFFHHNHGYCVYELSHGTLSKHWTSAPRGPKTKRPSWREAQHWFELTQSNDERTNIDHRRRVKDRNRVSEHMMLKYRSLLFRLKLCFQKVDHFERLLLSWRRFLNEAPQNGQRMLKGHLAQTRYG